MACDFLTSNISSLRPFGFRGYFVKDENYKKEKTGLKNAVVCIGKGKQIGDVEKALILKNIEWIESWKVFMPRANNISTELNDDNLNAFVGRPNEICTESYLTCFADDGLTEISVENAIKYMTTKFVRYSHSLSKSSQDATAKTFRFVPMQDFTNESDIDWSKSINEIDEQLFDKYGLSVDEREHIKSSIKDM